MFKILHHFNRLEKIISTLLVIIIIICGAQLVWSFYKENSSVVPGNGDIYREGIVGKIEVLNPVYTFKNDATRDISRLIYSGLVKYNPTTKTLEDDIATHYLSQDKKVYTFIVRDNARWHDNTPVTSNDIVFTYRDVIQNPSFDDVILKNTFKDVIIDKIDDRTVTFTLQKPYKFFLSNLTIGLLPYHLFSETPCENLGKKALFLEPIGSGPYKFVKRIQEGKREDIYLKKFKDYYIKEPYIEDIVVSIFPDFVSLNEKIDELDGVPSVPKEYRNSILFKSHFDIHNYELNQYVALFLNLDKAIFKDQKTRLGLQLATNKKELIEIINEQKIIDTPLLEINNKDWQYKFDPVKSAGAFYDSQWKIPKKGNNTSNKKDNIDSQPKEENFISAPNEGEDYITNDPFINIEGIAPDNAYKILINSYTLSKYKSYTKNWSYRVEPKYKNIKEGENIYTVYSIDKDLNKKKLDEIKINYIKDRKEYEKSIEKIKDNSIKETDTKEDKPDINIEDELEKYKGVIRENDNGEKLEFNLITTDVFPEFSLIANKLKEQWLKAGVSLKIEVLSFDDFSKRIENREYDILLFGQNLGYNLDAYPYWHSSQTSKNNGFNLSEYRSLKADILIEEIRATHNEDNRNKSLKELQKVMGNDIPAIFLYTPTYTYAIDKKIKGVTPFSLAIITDRYNLIENWYIKMRRVFNKDANWYNFFPWLVNLF